MALEERYLLFKRIPDLIDVLLIDRTTNENIKWCTDNYSAKGEGYQPDDPIIIKCLEGTHGTLILPRVLKSAAERKKRIKDKAEVFTPSWMCNIQNNDIDEQWFGFRNAFNEEIENGWATKPGVVFPNGKTWEEYVDAERMEVTCGEAPYLVSRYDTTDGHLIPVHDRIGLLDRKLRVVSENTRSEEQWYAHAKIAFQRIYGYEYQGDSLLIARENLLFDFIDFFEVKFGHFPEDKLIMEIAEIISWNLFQMDGLKWVVPNTCHPEDPPSLIPLEYKPLVKVPCHGCETGNPYAHNGIRCVLFDWRENKKIRFMDLMRGGYRYAW